MCLDQFSFTYTLVFIRFRFFFFFNDTATTEIYTLSLHDALPISMGRCASRDGSRLPQALEAGTGAGGLVSAECLRDRKSTRLNSSHSQISYAVFCLKKKKTTIVVFHHALHPSEATILNSLSTRGA